MPDDDAAIESYEPDTAAATIIPYGVREGISRGISTVGQAVATFLLTTLRDGKIGNSSEWFTNLAITALFGFSLGYLRNSGDVPFTRTGRAKRSANETATEDGNVDVVTVVFVVVLVLVAFWLFPKL